MEETAVQQESGKRLDAVSGKKCNPENGNEKCPCGGRGVGIGKCVDGTGNQIAGYPVSI